MAEMDTSKWDQIINSYDGGKPNQFRLLGHGAGSADNIVDINQIPEEGIRQLIGTYGNHPALTARLQYLVAQREKDAALNPKLSPEEALNREVANRAAQLEKRLDQIYGTSAEFGSRLIDENAGNQRRKAISEEAALGRLRSPVSASFNAPISNVDRNRDSAMNQLFAGLAGQRAGAQGDFAKVVESIFQNQRELDQQGRQFGQTLDFSKNKLQSDINENAATRALNRELTTAQLNSQRDRNTLSDWDRVTGQISGGLDLFSKVFPMQAPGGSGGAVTRGKSKMGGGEDPWADPAVMSMLFA